MPQEPLSRAAARWLGRLHRAGAGGVPSGDVFASGELAVVVALERAGLVRRDEVEGGSRFVAATSLGTRRPRLFPGTCGECDEAWEVDRAALEAMVRRTADGVVRLTLQCAEGHTDEVAAYWPEAARGRLGPTRRLGRPWLLVLAIAVLIAAMGAVGAVAIAALPASPAPAPVVTRTELLEVRAALDEMRTYREADLKALGELRGVIAGLAMRVDATAADAGQLEHDVSEVKAAAAELRAESVRRAEALDQMAAEIAEALAGLRGGVGESR